MGTGLVTLLLVVALAFGAIWIGQLLLGPLLSTLRWLAKSWPRPLPLPARRVLARSASDLADAALTRPSISERTFELEREGFRIKVRTSGNFVNAEGHLSGFPWSPEDWAEARPVVSSTVILNLEDRGVDLGGRHVELSSPANVSGDEALGWALSDDTLMEALPSGDRLVLANNRITLWSPFALERGRLDKALDAVVHLARRLLSASYKDGRLDLPSLCADTFRRSQDPETQGRVIFHLLAHWPGSAEAQALGPGALEHPTPRVRYRAALAVGQRGLPVLERLIDDGEVPGTIRAAALRSWWIAAPPEAREQRLDRPLASAPEEVLWVLVPLLARRRRSEDARRLALLLPHAHGELARELIRGLEALGNPDAEPALLVAYAEAIDEATSIAAADALSALGTPAALPMLLPATRALLQPSLRLAADAAVKAIRARHPEAYSGALALTDPGAQGGDLSVAPGESAALSPSDRADGPLGPADGRDA